MYIYIYTNMRYTDGVHGFLFLFFPEVLKDSKETKVTYY